MYYEILEITLDFGYDELTEETEDEIYDSILSSYEYEASNENELRRIIENLSGYKVAHLVAKLTEYK